MQNQCDYDQCDKNTLSHNDKIFDIVLSFKRTLVKLDFGNKVANPLGFKIKLIAHAFIALNIKFCGIINVTGNYNI